MNKLKRADVLALPIGAASNEDSSFVNKESQPMALFESTKMTSSMMLNPEFGKRHRPDPQNFSFQ